MDLQAGRCGLQSGQATQATGTSIAMPEILPKSDRSGRRGAQAHVSPRRLPRDNQDERVFYRGLLKPGRRDPIAGLNRVGTS